MKDELQEFSAQWVKKLRHQSGYTQEQFARAIGATSVTISRWERGIEPEEPGHQRNSRWKIAP